MENLNTKKKMKWYHYLLIFIFVVILVNLCSKSEKDKVAEQKKDEEITKKADSIYNTLAPKLPESNWTYRENEDKMTSKKKYYAYNASNNTLDFEFPYNGGSTANLNIRKQDGSTDVMLTISKGQFITKYDGVPVRLRFDDEPAFTVNASSASDGSADILFLGSEKKIISKLKKSKYLVIEAEFYKEGLRTMDFTTIGFTWEH